MNGKAESPILTFTTERLLLRPVSEADIPAYTRYFVDYEVIRHLSAAVPCLTLMTVSPTTFATGCCRSRVMTAGPGPLPGRAIRPS
jgi:hypothetical protein